METSKCEKIECCPFFEKHYPEKGGMYKGWVISFCENAETSKDCARKQYANENGFPPPVDMTPIGTRAKEHQVSTI